MANLSRAEILARKTGRDTVELPGGGTVAIRGLTHAEVVEGQAMKGLNDKTCFYVANAMIDPVMTFEDVQAWAAEGSAGDITTISERVQMLSGLMEGAGKSGVSGARKRR
jgi:hypothetical protein